MKNKNQQNNEWEKDLENIIHSYILGIGHKHDLCNSIKEFIKQQRKEAYEEGFVDGIANVQNAPEESFKLIKLQAVREFAEYIFNWIDKNDFDQGGGYYKIDCDDLKEALEVYEGK